MVGSIYVSNDEVNWVWRNKMKKLYLFCGFLIVLVGGDARHRQSIVATINGTPHGVRPADGESAVYLPLRPFGFVFSPPVS